MREALKAGASNAPVTDVTSQAIRCYELDYNATPGQTKTVTVNAGSTVTIGGSFLSCVLMFGIVSDVRSQPFVDHVASTDQN
jgi:hypothetical protein